jgi:hypothetical protein
MRVLSLLAIVGSIIDKTSRMEERVLNELHTGPTLFLSCLRTYRAVQYRFSFARHNSVRFFVVASAPSSTLAFHDGLTVFDAGLAQRVVFTQDRAFAQNIHRKIWST